MAPTTTPPTTTVGPQPAVGTDQPIGANFSPGQRTIILDALAAGIPIATIARTLGRPRHHIDRWLARHRLHTPRKHANQLVISVALILLGAGVRHSSVAALAGRSATAVSTWANRYDVPASAERDAVEIRFYCALLAGLTPAAAVAACGASLIVVDPDSVYSSDMHTAIADQHVAEDSPILTHPTTPQDTGGATTTTPAGRTARPGTTGSARPATPARSAAPAPAPVPAPSTPVPTQAPSPTGKPLSDRRARKLAAIDADKRTRATRGADRANRASHRPAAKPSRRRGRHKVPTPHKLPTPDPVTTLAPAAVVHPPQPADQSIDARYLSVEERDTMSRMLDNGTTQAEIARTLGRAPSTISREIARNRNSRGVYNPHTAARYAAGRRSRPKLSKVYSDRQLWALVAQGLEQCWSPEQISQWLRRFYPDNKEFHVCTETIYQALYVYPRGGLQREVKKVLRTGRTARKPHSGTVRQPRHPQMVNIVERSEDIEQRLLPGDWEGDLILGEFNRSAIGTLVDRKTRYVMLLHLPGAHDAVSVRDAMIERLSAIPEQLALSVTWDQGSEMALHREISTAVDVDIYFCDPHSPWQRGTNENTNGLLRQFFPKSTDLSGYTVEDLMEVEELMNNRPRKALGWATPAEALWEEIDGILSEQ